jgi:hypothetical protein
MKSIEVDDNGLSRTGIDYNKPYGQWHGVFSHTHIPNVDEFFHKLPHLWPPKIS